MKTSGTMSLDQLVALNDEIAALVCAGVPLEKGLTALGGDLPGGLGRIVRELGLRLESGRPLVEALSDAATSGSAPPVYRAVVEAGILAGRLPAALESLATATRQIRDLRRTAVAALAYPLLVGLIGWTLFLFFVARIVPGWKEFFDDFHVNDFGLLRFLAASGESVQVWGTAVPLAAMVVAAFWWYRSGRATLVEPRWAAVCFGWMPWVGRMLRASRTAVFLDVLALVVENDVPLEQGLPLAAEATGDRKTLAGASRLVEALGRGEPPSGRAAARAGLPPMVAWSIAAGQRRGKLADALRQAGRAYHRRAERAAHAARVFLPVLLAGGLGGLVALLYVLLLFGPYVTMLKTLGGLP